MIRSNVCLSVVLCTVSVCLLFYQSLCLSTCLFVSWSIIMHICILIFGWLHGLMDGQIDISSILSVILSVVLCPLVLSVCSSYKQPLSWNTKKRSTGTGDTFHECYINVSLKKSWFIVNLFIICFLIMWSIHRNCPCELAVAIETFTHYNDCININL